MKQKFWILFFVGVLFVVPTVFAQGENPPVSIGEVSAARVIARAAFLLSVLFDYFPGVAAAYDKLSVSAKKLWAVASAIVVVGVAFGLTCGALVTSNLTCSWAGAWDAITGVIYLIVVQYGIHSATKPSATFKRDVLKIPVKNTKVAVAKAG